MNKNTINVLGGICQCWDMDEIDITKSPYDQLSLLKEDLFQVIYKGNVLIDVGWYPEFSSSGQFQVLLLKNSDWDNPAYKKNVSTFKELIDTVNEAAYLASSE